MLMSQDWRDWPVALSRKLPQLLSAGGQRQAVLTAISLVLIAWIGYTLASLTWRLLPAVEPKAIPVVIQPVAAPAPKQSLNLGRLHLFGERVVGQVAPVAVKEMPRTRLKLILRGVVAGDAGGVSGAIIASPSGTQAFYAVGASLPGGAVLKEVHDRHIVLMRNGTLETLDLPRNSLDVGSEPAAIPPAVGAVNAQPLMSLSEYRDTLMTNPQQLMDVVQVRPYHRGGVTGYQINPGRDAAIFEQLGLLPNDVVTRVNGIRLDNPARGLNILRSLKKDSQVSVEIFRDGAPQTMTVDLNQ